MFDAYKLAFLSVSKLRFASFAYKLTHVANDFESENQTSLMQTILRKANFCTYDCEFLIFLTEIFSEMFSCFTIFKNKLTTIGCEKYM